MSLVAPYFGLNAKEQAEIDKFMPFIKMIARFHPHFRTDVMKRRKFASWLEHWMADPHQEGTKISMANLINNQKAMKQFNEKVIDKVSTPFIMFLAGQDDIVCNRAARNFFENCQVEDKDVIEYDEMSHFCFQDGEYWPQLANDIVSWQNTHL